MYFGYCLVMKHNVALYRGTMAWLGHEQLLEEGSEDEANLVLNQASAFLVPCMWRAGVLQTFLDPDTIESSAAIHAVHRLHGNVRQTFKQLDVDGDGSISVDELRGLLEMIGIERVEPAMVAALARKLDKNDNGKIDFHEFSQWYLASEERMKAELHEKFAELDTNRDGTICVPEFTQLLQKLRVKARSGPRRPAALASLPHLVPPIRRAPSPQADAASVAIAMEKIHALAEATGQRDGTEIASSLACCAAPRGEHPPSAPPPPPSRAGSLTRRLAAAAAGKAADRITRKEFTKWYQESQFWEWQRQRAEKEAEMHSGLTLTPPRGASCTDALKFYLVRCPAAPCASAARPTPPPAPLPTPRLRSRVRARRCCRSPPSSTSRCPTCGSRARASGTPPPSSAPCCGSASSLTSWCRGRRRSATSSASSPP